MGKFTGSDDTGENTEETLRELLLSVRDILKAVVIELRIMNKYNELGHDEVINEESIDAS